MGVGRRHAFAAHQPGQRIKVCEPFMSRIDSVLPLTRSTTVSSVRGSVSVWPSSRQLVRSRHPVPWRLTDTTRHDAANVSIERRVMTIGR